MSRKVDRWRREDLSKRYLDSVRGAIPLADYQIDTILTIIEKTGLEVRAFLDLGCGDGILGRRLVKTALIGHAVKSGKFFYYMCGNARRRGRDVCKTPLLPKAKIESFVTDRIKCYILTEENMIELVKLTNEELAQTCEDERQRLELVETQVGEVGSRLGKLYDALETGEFRSGDLAPRIKTLLDKREDLQRAKAEAEAALQYRTIEIADPEVVRAYVQDLRSLLESSGIAEQKAFLKSFVEGIEVGESEATIKYTFPMLSEGSLQETVGVLPFIRNGSSNRIEGKTRTFEKTFALLY